MTSGQIGRRFGETGSKVRVAMTRINADYRASTGGAEDVFGVRRVK